MRIKYGRPVLHIIDTTPYEKGRTLTGLFADVLSDVVIAVALAASVDEVLATSARHVVEPPWEISSAHARGGRRYAVLLLGIDCDLL